MLSMRTFISKSVLALALCFNVSIGWVAQSTIPLATVAVVVTVTQTACSKDQLVASAEDVLSVVTDKVVNDALAAISPFALAKLAKIIPSARDLVAAVKNSDSSLAAGLVADIFPVISEIAVLLSASPVAMGVLALANVGLHFLLNHLPSGSQAKSPKVRGSVSTETVDSLQTFKSERVWGCDFLPKDKRCTQ